MPANNYRFGEDSVTAIRRVLLSTGLCLSFISFGLIAPANAQQNTGALSGTVTASDGKAAADAAISARNLGTGAVHETKANMAGAYTFPALTPGRYAVTFGAAGSRTTPPANAEVAVARRSVLNVRLESGERSALSQPVVVPNLLLERESSVLGSEFSPAALAVTPLFVRGDLRNGELFATWLPGVTNGLAETDM